MAQTVKRLPTVQETQVQSLGQEDLLEKEMATHSSILFFFFYFILLYNTVLVLPYIDMNVHGILQARILEWVTTSFARAIFLVQGSSLSLFHLLLW